MKKSEKKMKKEKVARARIVDPAVLLISFLSERHRSNRQRPTVECFRDGREVDGEAAGRQ